MPFIREGIFLQKWVRISCIDKYVGNTIRKIIVAKIDGNTSSINIAQ
jgi:hypothetical protein